MPRVTSWIRASKDLKLVRDMGIRETGMLTSVSDYHLPQARIEPAQGHGRVPRHRQGGPLLNIVPRCPSRRDPGGYLRVLRALCPRAHEAPGGKQHRYQIRL